MNEDLTQLKEQVQELMDWKSQKERQQISYPIDPTSITILNKYFPRIINDLVVYSGGAAGRGFDILFLNQDTTGFQIQKDTSQIYTVNASTDIFTATKNGYPNGTQLFVATTDTIPGGLAFSVSYFVVSSSGLTFKLSATSGGSAINITTNGVGIQIIDYAL